MSGVSELALPEDSLELELESELGLVVGDDGSEVVTSEEVSVYSSMAGEEDEASLGEEKS